MNVFVDITNIPSLKKRNEDQLNDKLAHNLEREMEIKAVRDRSIRTKKERQEKMSRTRKAVEDARRKEVMRRLAYLFIHFNRT